MSQLNLNNLKLKDLIKGLCVNPTPFKVIDIFDEDESVEVAIKAFQNSDRKRKVIGVRTTSNTIYHIGENEMQIILNGLEHQS